MNEIIIFIILNFTKMFLFGSQKFVQVAFKIIVLNQRRKCTMEALVFDGLAMTVKHHTDFPKPQLLADDDVIVKIEYAGICGTDLHIIKGEFPARKSPPMPLGHESSGVIETVGKRSVFKVGQKVTIYPCSPCNLCEFCRLGIYQHCKVGGLNNYIGIAKEGGWAQYCLVPQQQIYLLPEGVTTKQGVLAEPYSCVVHTFERASPFRIGQKILVIGAGIIGNLFSSAFHHQGHRNVTVCESNKGRLALAKNLQTGFRLIGPDVLKKEKLQYDVMIDCTGVGKVMETCLNYMRSGGKYVVFGCCPPTHEAKVVPYQMFDKELTILGAKINPYTFFTTIDWMQAMGDRYIDFDKLGIKVYRLLDYKTALADLQSRKVAKAVFKVVD